MACAILSCLIHSILADTHDCFRMRYNENSSDASGQSLTVRTHEFPAQGFELSKVSGADNVMAEYITVLLGEQLALIGLPVLTLSLL